jgi:putative protein kinase ArgK-like GTPase of G3E family
MLWIGLKLLGLRKFIQENWKWLLPIAVLVAAFFIVSNTYYSKGVAAERATWEARVKTESAKNVKTTERIVTTVVQYAEGKQKEAEVRIKKETVYKDRILTLIQEIPADCKVSQEILDSRNAIRAEGP